MELSFFQAVAASIRSKSRRARQRRGVMMILIGILMLAFLATVAFSVDIAYMQLVNSELRASTDAAAKAAVTILVKEDDPAAAIQAAKDTAARNNVAGQPLPLENADIVLGSFVAQSNGKMTFSPGSMPLCAARVTGRRDAASSAGTVALFFGRVFGVMEFEPVIAATAVRLERDIVLVLDRSGSMGITTPDGVTKMEALKTSVNIFLDIVNTSSYEEQVGLVSYDHLITRNSDLTMDTSAIEQIVSGFQPGGATDIGDAITEGNSVLAGANSRNYAMKTIVLLTDGLHNTGSPPLTTALASQTAGTTIHTITFGTGADQLTMQDVAALTGGQHHHAVDSAQLQQVFEDIARSLTTILIE